MHIPDGFIDGPTSVAGAVAAAGLVGASVKKAAKDLDDRQIPLAGLTAAFIFALQMLNFPVANGTSGHLLGGCLAAVLVGPWVGSLCMTVVFIVQALVFADGGLTALGLNIILMGYVPCFVGYGIFLALRKALPASKGGVTASAAIAAWFGVVAASIVFTIYYAIGGTGDASVAAVGGAMVGVHVLVGIGEAVITGLTVGAVMAVRPDLVLRRAGPAAEARGAHPGHGGERVMARRAIGAFVAGGLVVAAAPRLLRQPVRQLQARRAREGVDRPGLRPARQAAGHGRRPAGRLLGERGERRQAVHRPGRGGRRRPVLRHRCRRLPRHPDRPRASRDQTGGAGVARPHGRLTAHGRRPQPSTARPRQLGDPSAGAGVQGGGHRPVRVRRRPHAPRGLLGLRRGRHHPGRHRRRGTRAPGAGWPGGWSSSCRSWPSPSSCPSSAGASGCRSASSRCPWPGCGGRGTSW